MTEQERRRRGVAAPARALVDETTELAGVVEEFVEAVAEPAWTERAPVAAHVDRDRADAVLGERSHHVAIAGAVIGVAVDDPEDGLHPTRRHRRRVIEVGPADGALSESPFVELDAHRCFPGPCPDPKAAVSSTTPSVMSASRSAASARAARDLIVPTGTFSRAAISG